MPLSSVAGYRGGGWQPHRPVELIPLPGSPVEKGQQTCPAQPTVSGLLQKTEFAHVAPRPTVEHRLSQLGAKAKLRAPTHRNRPQGAEWALRGSQSFPLPSLLLVLALGEECWVKIKK